MVRNLTLLAFLAACTGETAPTDTPEDTACRDGVCVLSGTLTEDMTLTADKAWLLRGGVFVGDDTNPTTLTVEPGTVVYGESATDGMLVVRRGSRLVAEGTADAPIVFTSSKAEGSRSRGDWGGLILNGRAPINSCAEGEGACEAFGEGGTGWYGGDDPDDDSGVLKYVRVEFAGTLVSPENELNGIAFQGVGRGTTVDYVQVHMNADDGIEFFGGTAEVKHVLVTGVGDDSLDWTDGWQGKAQFVVLQQYDDASGDNGIEADNNAENNLATPRSMPTLSNLTIIGSPASDKSDYGMLLREGTAAHIANALIVGFNDACLDIDHAATFAGLGTDLTLTNIHMDCATLFEKDDEDADGDDVEDADPMDIDADFFAHGAGNTTGDDGGLVAPFDLVAPDFTSTATGASIPADAFFETVDHIGGVGTTDWTAGWTTSAAN
ncbi:MAG: hypothetical protein H6736_20325 [Alphaproteobacteria bacterium]|nr:hypothetical protein [Alphaproteobacteria bacterium]